MMSLQCSIIQIKCFDLSFDMSVSFLPSQVRKPLNQAKHSLNVVACLCMSVRFCVCGLHAVQACVRTVVVPPSENRWIFFFFFFFLNILLHTLPLTLQGGSITAHNKHPVFGSKAQEVSVYCYWACVSHWITGGWDEPKRGMWA